MTAESPSDGFTLSNDSSKFFLLPFFVPDPNQTSVPSFPIDMSMGKRDTSIPVFLTLVTNTRRDFVSMALNSSMSLVSMALQAGLEYNSIEETGESNFSMGANGTLYPNGTWTWWFPGLNLTGNRGGGVAHQNVDSSKIDTGDAAWVLTATFIIFTMQSGFGLLEGGCVSIKNETNIMVKNVVDVVLGGLTYWMFGYGLSFGTGAWSNPFCGWGDFFLNADEDKMGDAYTTFFFQLSFATTATTVVSGAVAERFNFLAYVVFSAVNTVVYCIPAGWLWSQRGFLYQLGVIDIAGSCGVHLCGGASAFIAAKMVGPRLGRYDHGEASLPMGSPTTAVLGMLMLWWGWLGFNCGSTFGIRDHKWKYAARTAVNTIQGSIGGGLVGMGLSWYKNRQLEIADVINSILGALVAITAGCALFTTFESLLVGSVGGLIAVLTMPLVDKLHVDDPVGATSVHGLCGIWAMLSIGLFVKADTLMGMTGGRSGLFRGGGFYLLGVQTLACISIIVWSVALTYILLKLIDMFVVKIRMSEWEELVGADFAEHGFRRRDAGITRATSVLGFVHHNFDYATIPKHGDNPCHVSVLDRLEELNSRRGSTISKAIRQVTEEWKRDEDSVPKTSNSNILDLGFIFPFEGRFQQTDRNTRNSTGVRTIPGARPGRDVGWIARGE